MPYSCIIVEDNAVERDLLELLLHKMQEVTIAGVFENAIQALHFLQQHQVDIAFTDIDMPELSGIDLLKSLRHPPVFVFISAHGEYAVDGYNLDVADFIKKPVHFERLFRALHKAVERLNLSTNLPVPPGDDTLMVRTSEGIHKLTPASIVYAESKSNYSCLYLDDGTTLMILIALKQLEEQLLQAHFIRIHKSYLVNWKFVSLIRKDTVVLAGNHELPVGESHRKELADRIANHPTLARKLGREDPA